MGTLPDGTEFTIDALLIPTFNKYYWHKNSKGYISRGNRGLPKLLLHWLALGFKESPENILIDHINRVKTDCSTSNLRLVTIQQNAMNRSIGRNNTTGYVGVCHIKDKNRYIARIGLDNQYIYLGSSKDPIECAQMYNLASQFLFGEYRGHQNDVPQASLTLQKRIQDKCRPYMVASQMAKMPCTINESA